MIKALASISALLASVGLLLVGHGLQTTLLPLAARQASFTDFEIGLVSSAYFVGMVLGCLASPYVIMRAGHIRAFAALVSLMSAAAILHPVFVDPLAWFLVRVISGFCLAGFYMIVESWLNEAASNENRGTIMSVYIVVLYAAMMLGQVSISGLGISGFVPFVAASVMVSLAVIPVSLTTANQPAPITLVRFRPVRLYRTSPAAFVSCLLIGVASGALWTLAPLYGAQIGLSTNQAAFYTAAIIGGGVVAQWPFGRLSDRIDRRLVLVGLAVATFVISLAIVTIEPASPVAATLFALVIGVFSQPAYAIAVAHAFDHADADAYVETSSGLLLSFGLGSIIGPISASLLMQDLGPSGLYYQVAAVQVVTVAYIATRLFARQAMTPEEKLDFEYAATAQVGTVISPEPLDVADPDVIPPEEFPAYEDAGYSPEVTEETLPVGGEAADGEGSAGPGDTRTDSTL
ncbi:MFS transporter [Polymorphum gilvum]|uniref:Twin-arginine translocation pathway signal n=1 Tax=Polymorphum gilvum (strain LMG 25793 / CGMCC 1.9160 / SL003B-26A1) TaxID=991905 RepID=F2IYB0_POLGS|nr:MFS transporter [Polymorphum gilvum]ADZ71722.1 Twin-arginine translocation pathway signal [Polymorphum gilvum SL003B-26A1]